MTGTPTAVGAPVELVVGGMSCAACAARIEKRLNLLDGVAASVNYATERAYIAATGGRDIPELITAIEAAGYTAAIPGPDGADGPVSESRARRLGWRLAACVPLAVGVVILAMVPAAQFRGWQWVSLVLALPVALWGAWPLHQAAWASLRHASATMDTLVSLGIAASFIWSLYALCFGGAGSAAGPGITVRQVAIPAHGTLSLNPFGLDIVLQDPGSLTVGATVPLVLTFRHAGRVTVYAAVTPPGTP
jgi:Cu+-exporting ATPase